MQIASLELLQEINPLLNKKWVKQEYLEYGRGINVGEFYFFYTDNEAYGNGRGFYVELNNQRFFISRK